MAARRWTRDELIALAQGREITARDLHAGEVDPPAWLLAHAKGRYPYDSKQSTELIHPEDRNILIDSFLTCASTPGEPLVYRMRSRGGGHWHHGQTTWVNLIDHDEVGSLLAFIRTVDGPPVVP